MFVLKHYANMHMIMFDVIFDLLFVICLTRKTNTYHTIPQFASFPSLAEEQGQLSKYITYVELRTMK